MSGDTPGGLGALVEAALEVRVVPILQNIANSLKALTASAPPSPAASPTAAGGGGWDFRGHADQAFGHITYAQFGEDLILANIFHILGIVRPGFIDIGAHHPLNVSNTALLYRLGSRGINIEANPELIQPFADLRPEDTTLNVGVGPVAGIMDFYMIDDWSGRNTFDRETAERFVAAEPQFSIRSIRKIEIVTLDEVVDQHCQGKFPDLLCIDAEGLDYRILASSAFGAGSGREGPVVVCVEAVSGDDRDDGHRLGELLRSRGYVPFVRTIGNIIFVRAAEAARLQS